MTARPRLAPGFTVTHDTASVWLIAGEDVRYKLGCDDPRALAAILAHCDGRATLDELLAGSDIEHRADGAAAIARLIEERVIVEGTAAAAHEAVASWRVTGRGALADALGAGSGTAGGPEAVEVFVQDRLDYAALLAHNAAALADRRRWLWVTTGPGGRAYIGPLFVPDAGPCAACLILHFKRLSPVPELYDLLIAHGERGEPIAPTEFPAAALATTAALARWKLELAAAPVASSALYALHVIELADLTTSAYAPLVDPECVACRR